ncbi:MAG TPA: VOC family protein [Acidimicrobiia bacterium]|nr:VOC family protein [Acidimicrobiia bacterium]HZQ76495.1 VOC family protein [Acidimicrobiia bacterium]
MEVLQSRVLYRPVDYQASVAFYRDVVGLHVFREWATGTVFFLGGGLLELSRPAGPVTDDKLSLWLHVRDVDAEFARLAAAGVDVVEAPVDEPWGLREARIRDPDGLLLVLVEIPPSHPMRRGRD